MIFVTVGTNEATFDRLLRAVDTFTTDEELLVQHGPSTVRPSSATCVDYLSFDDVIVAVRRARIVITHAGVGSMLSSLANGKRPVVVPRLARFGEAVDDHQVPLGRRLGEEGLVLFVEDPADLESALTVEGSAAEAAVRMDERLVGDLRSFLLEQAARS